jgi:meiotically up-regulated gene 157 (Mug157) protein
VGIGGPHEGKDLIWPMSQIIYALTSTSDPEIRAMLRVLAGAAKDSGFIHESYTRNNSQDFTRA